MERAGRGCELVYSPFVFVSPFGAPYSRAYSEGIKGRPKRKDGTLMTRTLCRQGGGKGPQSVGQAAQIAKIPFELARWIAHVYKPEAVRDGS